MKRYIGYAMFATPLVGAVGFEFWMLASLLGVWAALAVVAATAFVLLWFWIAASLVSS